MKKLKKIGRFFGGVVCVIVGIALSGFGISQLFPKKKYGGGTIDVEQVPEASKTPDEE